MKPMGDMEESLHGDPSPRKVHCKTGAHFKTQTGSILGPTERHSVLANENRMQLHTALCHQIVSSDVTTRRNDYLPEQHVIRGVAGNCSEHNVEQDHGDSQDVIYKDEERITKVQTLVDRLQDGCRTKSIMYDLKQDGKSNEFSEASRRKIKDIGNIGLYELGETDRANQCSSCLRHSKEGTVYCVCGKCLMPSPEQTEKIKNRIDLISDPLYVIKQGTHGERHGPEERQYHWKAEDATTNVKKRRFTTFS